VKLVTHSILARTAPTGSTLTCTKWTPYATFAIQFVDDGLYGTIPASIQNYLDYDAIARDLGMDYSEITIDGTRYIYRCD
jgi:hypothetical protein